MARMSRSCIFCKIAARRAPAYVIDEDERSLCLLDINPFAEGHCLVISKRHVPWWHDLSEQEIVSLFLMAKRVAHWCQPLRVMSWTASSTRSKDSKNRLRRWQR
jgi:galactose-1-phosphate uridylyltransferase